MPQTSTDLCLVGKINDVRKPLPTLGMVTPKTHPRMGRVKVKKCAGPPQNGDTSEFFSVVYPPHFGVAILYVARGTNKIFLIFDVLRR